MTRKNKPSLELDVYKPEPPRLKILAVSVGNGRVEIDLQPGDTLHDQEHRRIAGLACKTFAKLLEYDGSVGQRAETEKNVWELSIEQLQKDDFSFSPKK
jgi:hypothetical protein